MKRFLTLLLVLVPLGASAQNKAIDALAKKYADRDGFSTSVIKGDLSAAFAGSINIEGVDIANIIANMSSIVLIRSTTPSEEFTRDVNHAISEGYSPLLSSSSNGDQVRFLLAENDDNKNEFVIVILGNTTNLLMSIVGDYTLGKVSKLN
jgi:hypothetical protein